MSSGILALRGNSNTPRLRGPLSKNKRSQSQDKKVLARNNAIFVKGNSLPHALTFEMYEANVRDNLYNKSRGLSNFESTNNINCCNTRTRCIEDEMNDLHLETEEIKDCLNVKLQTTFDTASINQIPDPEDSQKSMDLSSNNSIEALVNYYTLRYQSKRSNFEDTKDQIEQSFGAQHFADSPLVSDEFNTQDIDMALSATSTPKSDSAGRITTNNIYQDSYEEYSMDDLSASLLNSNGASTGAENSSSKVRILVGLIGRCKLIDCNLNDDNIPRPEYRKYTPKRIFNPKSSAVSALKIQSPSKAKSASPAIIC